MGERIVVHSVTDDAEADGEVTRRLKNAGIDIIEQQPHMLLVEGDHQAVRRALGDIRGWVVSPVTETPPPRTRERVLKKP
jgi:hypothetical protein